MNDRLVKMVEYDDGAAIKRTLKVARADVFSLLSEFMEISDIDMRAEKAEGGYTLIIKADVARFFEVGNTTDREL